MKTRGWLLAVAVWTAVGLMVGLCLHPSATIKNADIEMRSGGEAAHIHFVNCQVTASGNALEINLHDNKFSEDTTLVRR